MTQAFDPAIALFTNATTGTSPVIAVNQCSAISGFVSSRTGTTSGVLVIEVAPATDYAGTWAIVATVDLSTTGTAPVTVPWSYQGALSFVRARITTTVAGGGTPGASVTLTGIVSGWPTAVPNNQVIALDFGALGTTQTDGLTLQNAAAAANSAQQISPALRFTAQGWKTNATAGSQPIGWRVDAVPIQSTATPLSYLRFSDQINNGTWTEALTVSNIGSGVYSLGFKGHTNAGNANLYSEGNYLVLNANPTGGNPLYLNFDNTGGTVDIRSVTLINGQTQAGASNPALSVSQTWNNGATAFTGILVRATDTASAASSLLLDLGTVGAGSLINFRKDGFANSASSYSAGSSAYFMFSGRSRIASSADGNVTLWNNAVNAKADLVLKKVTEYNAITTAGAGVSSIVGFTSQKAETTSADANVLTVTPAAVVGTYEVKVAISVASATSGVISWTLSYKDSNGNAVTNVAQQLFQQGTAAPNTTFTTSAAGNYYGSVVIDVDTSATNIVVKWVGGGTTSAKMTACIERLN